MCHPHLDSSLLAFLVLFLRLHLHQVFEERHQRRRVYAPRETECKFGSLLTWNDSSVFFCLLRLSTFQARSSLQAFLINDFFSPPSSNCIYLFHFIPLQWVLELKPLIFAAFIFVLSLSLKSTANWEILNWGAVRMQTSVSWGSEKLNDLAWLSLSARHDLFTTCFQQSSLD